VARTIGPPMFCFESGMKRMIHRSECMRSMHLSRSRTVRILRPIMSAASRYALISWLPQRLR
jgi:hypothetical protein